MNAKEFLGGLLEENKPQVVSFQNGAYVQVINLEAEEVAEYIRGLTKYQRLLLRTRISRHQMAAGYELRIWKESASRIFSEEFCCRSFGKCWSKSQHHVLSKA